MRKEEFLQSLRRSLNGDVPPGVIEENIRYYDSYITSEVLKGRTEEEVTAEIGDPRLIARTIEDTTDGAEDNPYSTYSQSYTYEDPDRRSDDVRDGNSYGAKGSFHYIDLNKWYWKLLILVVVFAVLYLVFAIVGGILSLLAPILVPLLVIWMVVWIFRMNNRR